MTIDRLVKSKDRCTISEVSDAEIALETADADRIVELRTRLSSISFFMKALCEHIGHRANREDGCTGRFFEGRFGCRWLADEAAILVCGIYVDLHQIFLLERLGINGQFWTELTTKFDRCFGHVVGRAADVAMRASQAGRQFYRGQARCADAFG